MKHGPRMKRMPMVFIVSSDPFTLAAALVLLGRAALTLARSSAARNLCCIRPDRPYRACEIVRVLHERMDTGCQFWGSSEDQDCLRQLKYANYCGNFDVN